MDQVVVYFRRNDPRYQGANFDANMRVASAVRELAQRKGATPAQISLAWLLHKGLDITLGAAPSGGVTSRRTSARRPCRSARIWPSSMRRSRRKTLPDRFYVNVALPMRTLEPRFERVRAIALLDYFPFAMVLENYDDEGPLMILVFCFPVLGMHPSAYFGRSARPHYREIALCN